VCEFDIFLSGLLRLFLERMQNVNGVCKLDDVNDTLFAQHVDSNFHGTLPNLWHGLPVGWHQPLLDKVQLEAGDPTGLQPGSS